MDEVTFEEKFEQPRTLATPRVSGLTAWVIRIGYAQDVRGANRLMIITASIALVAAIAIFAISSRGQTYEPPDPTDTVVPSMQYGS